jgi:hypothetical protein
MVYSDLRKSSIGKMSSIYVLTDPAHEKVNHFKVGQTCGSHGQLLSQYLRCMPQAYIILYEAAPNAREVERRILESLNDKRIPNNNGRLSEWVEYDRAKLLSLVKAELRRTPSSIPDTCPSTRPAKLSTKRSRRETPEPQRSSVVDSFMSGLALPSSPSRHGFLSTKLEEAIAESKIASTFSYEQLRTLHSILLEGSVPRSKEEIVADLAEATRNVPDPIAYLETVLASGKLVRDLRTLFTGPELAEILTTMGHPSAGTDHALATRLAEVIVSGVRSLPPPVRRINQAIDLIDKLSAKQLSELLSQVAPDLSPSVTKGRTMGSILLALPTASRIPPTLRSLI